MHRLDSMQSACQTFASTCSPDICLDASPRLIVLVPCGATLNRMKGAETSTASCSLFSSPLAETALNGDVFSCLAESGSECTAAPERYEPAVLLVRFHRAINLSKWSLGRIEDTSLQRYRVSISIALKTIKEDESHQNEEKLILLA